MSKYFVLDTNVLIHNPDAIYSFGNNTVVVPLTVIEELDKFKTASDKKGMHARKALREMDSIARDGALKEGAPLKTGGKLQIMITPRPLRIADLDPIFADHKILAVAFFLQEEGKQVYFISKDFNLRIKAEALGLQTADYDTQKVEYEDLYKGWRELVLPEKNVDEFADKGEINLSGITLFPNECVWIKSIDNPKKSFIGTFDANSGLIKQIKGEPRAMDIVPINLEQKFAYELLMNDQIKLVSLVGGAGTGKTLMALACGLEQIIGRQKRYQKLLVARPIMPLGKDIGYLPGTKDQKLNYWMQPIFDNLEFIISRNNRENREKNKDKSDSMSNNENGHSSGRSSTIDYLLDAGYVEIEAITYIRGRSIPDQFIIIDEAQNLTPHEIKTIVSRAGEGTKIVLTGDAEQIDNPYLDANTNGLTYSAERLKEHSITGHVFLSKSERSELASLAATYL